MMRLKLIFALIGMLTIISCGVNKPRNLNQAVKYFQHKWTQSELDHFKNKPEEIAVSELHFNVGMWIRNNWIRGNRDKALIQYFHSLGIYNAESISSIILVSLHRTLNHKNIDLVAQVNEDKAAWKSLIDCTNERRKKAVYNYNKFEAGDSITIYMPVDTSESNRNAVMYDCPTTEWAFDSTKDLRIKGIVDRKYIINDTANVFVTVLITNLNHLDVSILMKSAKTGDKIDFSLGGLTVE